MPTPTWLGPTDQLIEMPDSPVYDLGTDPSCTRTYMGTYEMALAGALPRGTYGSMAMAGWIVKKSTINRLRGGIGKLTINWGASGAGSGQQLPPPEVGIVPFEINPDISRNARYSSLTNLNWQTVQASIHTFKKDGATPTDLPGLLGEVLEKIRKGQTTYYLSGFKYTWTQSFYSLIGAANVGGYIQAPGGPLASFIPGAFSCLRLADDIKWTGAMYKYTQSWLCAPAAHWDPDLYTL